MYGGVVCRCLYINYVIWVQNIGRGIWCIIFQEYFDWYLNGNGMYIKFVQFIFGWIVLVRGIVQIKNIVKVDEERIVYWIVEYLFFVWCLSDCFVYQVGIGSFQINIVFNRVWFNIIWWYYVFSYDGLKGGVFVYILFYGISGFEVLLFQLDIEECCWVFVDFLESKLVDDFIIGYVCIIIDMDFILDVFFKSIVIGAIVGQFCWDVVGNDGNCVRVVGVFESVNVCIICQWIVCNQWSFMMV